MKTLACVKFNDIYKTVTVLDVFNGKKINPNFWNNTKFYSTHLKPENKVELVYVNNNGTLFFRYMKKSDEHSYKNNNPNSETLTHQLCKDYISKLSKITFIVRDKMYTFDIINSEVEKTISIKNKYMLDVFFDFKNSSPSYMLQKWNGNFIVEICVTHKVDDIKKKELYNFKFPIFEVIIPSHIKDAIENTPELSDTVLQSHKLMLEKYFSGGIPANLISNPSSEYFHKIQVDKLYNEYNALKSTSNEALSVIQKLRKIIEDEKNITSKLELEVVQYKKQTECFQNSFFYKLYKLFNRR